MVATFSSTVVPYLSTDSPADRLFRNVVERNDHTSFRELFLLFYKPLVRQAIRFVKLPEIAEEGVSDVFVRIWKNRSEINIRTAFRPYLYQAVRNQSLDYLKSTAHFSDNHDELPSFYYEKSLDINSPEVALICKEINFKIESVVSRLPTQCQTVFRLSRDKGLKYREIAEELGLSVKTVETHLGRAFKVLREELAEYR